MNFNVIPLHSKNMYSFLSIQKICGKLINVYYEFYIRTLFLKKIQPLTKLYNLSFLFFIN